MKLTPTALPDVVIGEPVLFSDERGWFYESFHEHRFRAGLEALGLPAPGAFVQDNHSRSGAGVLRGLHYQLPPHAQGRLLRVVRGAAYDVAVDLRRASPLFGHWVGIELSADNRLQMWIPPGFAHGFLALEEGTEVVYKATDVYAPACERVLRWDDPALAIPWPIAAGSTPRMAARDAHAPLLAQAALY
jgi:dTDP-4-dehydrorhamnose 3,5-epimerase